MPCHLSTYGTRNKECTSPDGTIQGQGAHEGSFPLIVSKYVAHLSCYDGNTLQIVSFVTAALHVVDIEILLCTVWITLSGFYLVSQNWIKMCGIQKGTRNKQEQHINKGIENFVSESCSNFPHIPPPLVPNLCDGTRRPRGNTQR